MLYAVSTHLLEIKTINPFCIRKIGEGQLPSLIILNIRKFTKKCSFSSYGKQYARAEDAMKLGPLNGPLAGLGL